MPKEKAKSRTSPDATEKILEDYNDVFADILNGTLFGGKKLIKEEALIDGPTKSQYKAAEGKYSFKDRDVLKFDQENGVIFAIYGIENQTKINRVMPVRVMGYDYSSYEYSVRKLKEKNKKVGHEADYAEEIWPGQTIPPVVTLVLYFGEEPWDGPRDLYDLVEIREELKNYVPNYPLNIVEVAFLSDEELKHFSSDFKALAEFFRAKRLGNDMELLYNSKQKWDHTSEMMDFLHTFTNDKRYEELKSIMIEESRRGGANMCTLADKLENKGKAEGMIIGKFQSVQGLMENTNLDFSTIADALKLSPKEREEYVEWAKENKELVK